MKLSKISLILLIGFFIFLALPLSQAWAAYTYIDLTCPQTGAGYPDLSYIMLTTGVLAKVQVNQTYSYLYNKVHVFFVSIAGAELANVEITISTGSNNERMPRMATIVQLDSDEVLVMTAVVSYAAESGYFRCWLYATRVNFISYIASSNYIVTIESYSSGSSETLRESITRPFYYDSAYYVMVHMMWKGTNLSYERIALIGYVPSTNVITAYDEEQISASPITAGWSENILGFQNEDNPQYAYCIMTETNTPTTPEYYIVDLDTETLEKLATHPFSSRWTSNRRLQFIGNGTYTDGDDIYLYFTWIYPYISSGTSYYHIIQHRMRFNETTIDSDNLQEQNERLETLASNSAASEEWIWGYEEEKDSYIYYHPYNHPTMGEIVLKRRITITDWTDFTTTEWDTIESLEEAAGIFPYNDDNDIIGRNPAYPYETAEGSLRVYYGLGIIAGDYDQTLSYTPADVPLLETGSYVFTSTGTQNGIGFLHYQILYVDGAMKTGSKTSNSGVYKFSIGFGVGIHNVTISMYTVDGVTYLHNETWIYSVQPAPTTGPTAGTAVTVRNFVQIMAYGLPALFLVFGPVVALATIKNLPPTIAVIVGLSLGTTVGLMTGIIPIYLGFLLILGIIVIFVYVMQGRN